MYHIVLAAKLNIFETFGNIAGFAGLALAVFYVIIRLVITKKIFPNQIVMAIIICIFLLSIYSIYTYYNHKDTSVISAQAGELKADGKPYEYIYKSGESGLGNVYTFYRTYDNLNDEFDVDIKNKKFSPLLFQSFLDLANSGEQEYARISSLSADKPINALAYLQGVIIGGSYLRLALLYEMGNPNKAGIVQYANMVAKAVDTALYYVYETSKLLSANSRAAFSEYLTRAEQIDRWNFTKFLAKSLLYKYDPASAISSNDLITLYGKVNLIYVTSHTWSDTTSYPIMAWLKNQKIINF